MFYWTKDEAKEKGGFYVNWFGKYMLLWTGLNLLGGKKWHKFSDDEIDILQKTLLKSEVVQKLYKRGKSSKEVIKILDEDYDVLNKVGKDFEKTFGVKWPL